MVLLDNEENKVKTLQPEKLDAHLHCAAQLQHTIENADTNFVLNSVAFCFQVINLYKTNGQADGQDLLERLNNNHKRNLLSSSCSLLRLRSVCKLLMWLSCCSCLACQSFLRLSHSDDLVSNWS